jgi:hypothetical protein
MVVGGTPDWNRRTVRNTPYADWFESLAKRTGLNLVNNGTLFE